MPQAALTAVVFAAQAIGTAASATAVAVAGASAATLAAGAALASIAYTSYSQKKAQADARKDSARAPRDITVRSAIEPARIIYGKARTSGPVVYTNTAPTPGTNDNSTLWTVISLCQHEIEDITEIWLDGDQIPSSLIRWSIDGGVSSGKYGPIGGNYVTNFYRRLGTDTQTHVTELATAFSDWTSAYDGKGVAYIVTAFELGTATGEGVWAQGAPQNIRAVVKGKKVYDPRKDSTQTGGSGAHRLADPTTWEWSDNPALCLADYLFDARLGMGAEGVTYDDIDWDLVADAADVCDATVTIPGGTEKRFTCNGALSTGETYAENIKQLLSSMSGQITWSGGKYRIRAAAYEAPTYTFTGDDVIGDVQIQPERTRTQRYNKIRGTYIDPDSDYVATEFIPVENTSYKNTRDGGQTLTQEIRLPFTNSEYMAQRIAFKQLNLNNQQLRCIVPFNWKAMKVAVGDRIQLSIDELSWSNKVFRVDGWSFSPDSGFNLTLQEDSSSAYADPLLAEYSTRTLAGTVSFADQAVSAPSGLQATSEEEAIFLEWEAPPRASGYDEVIVFASADSSWSNASEIARTRGNTYRHELTNGTTRYYWVRAVDVDGRVSTRDPDSDTSAVTATAGQISTSQLNDDANFAETADWPQITGTGKPVDNATRNVIYQQASEPTTGLNDGDIWIDTDDGYRMYLRVGGAWVDRSDTRIAQALADAATAQSTADGKIVTFYQDGEPSSADEGDLWIDTNDDNKLYRYSGSAWVLARDSGIASAISAATTAQDTADGKVTTFYAASGAPPTAEATGDLWYQTDTALLFRWNGSAWQEVASYNTGALADKDTVGAGDIDEGAVQGKTIALLLNKNSDGTANSGEGAFVGVNNAGEPVPNTDGFIIFDNVKYNIPRNQVSSVTFATQRLGKKGYVVFDAAGSNFYIQAGGGVFTRVAFVYKEGSTWYYDDNSNPNTVPNPPTFTPGSNHLAIAFLETDPITQDVILYGGLLAEPVQLTALSEISADYISVGLLNADRIQIDNVTLDTSGGNLIIANEGVDTGQLALSSVSESSTATAANYSGSPTTATDTGLSITLTVPANATVLLQLFYEVLVSGSASTDKVTIRIYENSTSTVLTSAIHGASGGIDLQGPGVQIYLISNTSGSSFTETYKVDAKVASALSSVQITDQTFIATELKR